MTDALSRLKTTLSDHYTIVRELGAGGMATVYLAEDLKHHRKVAVKVLRPELAAALGSERFLREIEVMAGLTQPHILPLFDSGEADGFLYYVMPHITGESLRQRLNREAQLPIDQARRIAQQVASALDFAHRHGRRSTVCSIESARPNRYARVREFTEALRATESAPPLEFSIPRPHAPDGVSGDTAVKAVRVPDDQRPIGGTRKPRQIFDTSLSGISTWRGTDSSAPLAGLHHSE